MGRENLLGILRSKVTVILTLGRLRQIETSLQKHNKEQKLKGRKRDEGERKGLRKGRLKMNCTAGQKDQIRQT